MPWWELWSCQKFSLILNLLAQSTLLVQTLKADSFLLIRRIDPVVSAVFACHGFQLCWCHISLCLHDKHILIITNNDFRKKSSSRVIVLCCHPRVCRENLFDNKSLRCRLTSYTSTIFAWNQFARCFCGCTRRQCQARCIRSRWRINCNLICSQSSAGIASSSLI
jgi:hypothetical protein